ncbi:sulfotransferase family protein [Novosphingobium cyanobacteriorum]|uniref:Sulfotransferase n=1 Tax=Novosphingobium cyanobacteriorum TaxID=3024215 RepID=A0ABT6CKZ4_9SPHN|nr:sulfotransferase [Novosphingobium cyanobacteriorum]MDF8334596.1 sulfotransferase [Novosphingobium cyanobacteriorum]
MTTVQAQDHAAEAIAAGLCEEASRRTGLVDFGPDDFRMPLAMVAAHLTSPLLSDVGRASLREDLVVALVGRLVRENEWKKNPGWQERKIDRPLIICGIPRTGTTALHKLLSVDPQFQGLEHWLTSWPMPRPQRTEWPQQQGYRNAVAALEKLFELIPQLRISHEIVADEVDECLEILRLDFIANRFPSIYMLPDYDAWFQAQDETPLYRRLADTIRLIGLHDNRTWLLKNPGHFGHLDELFEAFPDARVVITHRDPVKSLGSLGSVLAGGRQMFYADPQIDTIGPRELTYWSRAKEATDRTRCWLPAGQILDVDHLDFHRAPIGTVRKIYDHFGLTLSDEVATSMEAWLASNPADKHGAHSYRLEDYGITADRIRSLLGEG